MVDNPNCMILFSLLFCLSCIKYFFCKSLSHADKLDTSLPDQTTNASNSGSALKEFISEEKSKHIENTIEVNR